MREEPDKISSTTIEDSQWTIEGSAQTQQQPHLYHLDVPTQHELHLLLNDQLKQYITPNNPLKLPRGGKKHLKGQVFSDLHYHNPPLREESTSIKRAHPPHKGGVRKISFIFFYFFYFKNEIRDKSELQEKLYLPTDEYNIDNLIFPIYYKI